MNFRNYENMKYEKLQKIIETEFDSLTDLDIGCILEVVDSAFGNYKNRIFPKNRSIEERVADLDKINVLRQELEENKILLQLRAEEISQSRKAKLRQLRREKFSNFNWKVDPDVEIEKGLSMLTFKK